MRADTRRLPWHLAGLAVALLVGATSQMMVETLPRLRDAALPAVPPDTAGGGEVLLELSVSENGRVENVTVLRRTAPFTEPLVSKAYEWAFEPGRGEEDGAISSHVLLAALFRSRATYQGTTAGEPPADIAPGSPSVPYPFEMLAPPYPPNAYEEGLTLLEVRVNPEGDVESARIVASLPGFEDIALDTVRNWRFRPARREGQPVAGIALVLLGFLPPVVT